MGRRQVRKRPLSKLHKKRVRCANLLKIQTPRRESKLQGNQTENTETGIMKSLITEKDTRLSKTTPGSDLRLNMTNSIPADERSESFWHSTFDAVEVKSEIILNDDVEAENIETNGVGVGTTETNDFDSQTTEAYDEQYGLEMSIPTTSPPYKRLKLQTHNEASKILDDIDSSSSKRTEEIHQALSKMIAINQMPISFCSSEGFLQFMTVVDPSYKPLSEDAIKKRLLDLKQKTENLIMKKIAKASGVSCSADCWTSATQASYMTIRVHLIDEDWTPLSFTLETVEIGARYEMSNLANRIDNIFRYWGLSSKVMAVVIDNSPIVTKAIESLRDVKENLNKACAAYSLQLTVKSTISSDNIQRLIEKAAKVVSYLKNSNAAKYSLAEEQKQTGLPEQALGQSCFTKWTSISARLQWLTQNRIPVVNVLKNRSVTSSVMATKLTISEEDWTSIGELAQILRPIEALTKIICKENSPTSMVRPLVHKLLEKHMMLCDSDSDYINLFKTNFSSNVRQRFHLQKNIKSETSIRTLASLLDPRYKDLEHESYDMRVSLRDCLVQLLSEYASTRCETSFNTPTANEKSEFDILYDIPNTNDKNIQSQFEAYFDEPQLRFDLSPYEWWKYKEDKFPSIALLARKYLSIPATCVTSENFFSLPENMVTAESTSLLSENIDLLVFLYQNRKCFHKS